MQKNSYFKTLHPENKLLVTLADKVSYNTALKSQNLAVK